MKWKASEPIAPIAGSTRVMSRFAYVPRRIGNAFYWLCQYEVLQVWHVDTVMVMIEGKQAPFTLGKWLVVSEKPVKWIPA